MNPEELIPRSEADRLVREACKPLIEAAESVLNLFDLSHPKQPKPLLNLRNAVEYRKAILNPPKDGAEK